MPENERWAAEREEHLRAVADWLNANVLVIDQANQVALSRFEWPGEEDRSVSFRLSFDGRGDHLFRMWADEAGAIGMSPPMFHSPLGAPASFAAIELSPRVEAAVRAGLRALVPPLKPLGTDRGTGEEITMASSLRQRLYVPLEAVRDRLLQDGLVIRVDVATLKVTAV